MELSGISVIVTGGASGIGAASAWALTKRGARCVELDLNDDFGQALASAVPSRPSTERRTGRQTRRALRLTPRGFLFCFQMGTTVMSAMSVVKARRSPGSPVNRRTRLPAALDVTATMASTVSSRRARPRSSPAARPSSGLTGS